MKDVYVKFYEPPEFNRREILRYTGVREATDETVSLMEECISLARGKSAFKVCYTRLPIEVAEDTIDMGFAKVKSAALQRALSGCDKAVVLAATIGIEMDRLVARYSALSPSKGLMLQAIGAERIECLCDLFCADLKAVAVERGESIRPRFSPGYGDLELELQRDIFYTLDCPRKIGLTLNDSLLMSPTKSVTAIVGISSNGA